MALAYDTVTDGGQSSSFSHTNSSSPDRVLAVGIYEDSDVPATAISYGGVAMTKITGANTTNAGATKDIQWWGLIGPASGANTVSVTTGGTIRGIAAISFTGGNAFSGGTGNNNAGGASVSNTVTSATGNMTVDMYGYGKSPDSSALGNQTSRLNTATGSFRRCIQTASGASSVTMTWTPTVSGGTQLAAAFSVTAGSQSTAYDRSLSDSISVGASRVSTVDRVFGAVRAASDSVSVGASRVATIARVTGAARSLSDSVSRAASRAITVASAFTAGRSLSDSISYGASRTVTLARGAGTFARILADSVSVAASRVATLLGSKVIERFLSDSISVASGRFVTKLLQIIHFDNDPKPVSRDFGGMTGASYRIRFVLTGTLGTVTAKLGTGSSQAFAAGSGLCDFTGTYTAPGGIIFQPSATFDGTLDDVRIDKA